MGKPTILQHLRQTLGRALRETGQALDRLGIKGHSLATTKRIYGDDPVIYQDFLSRHRQFMPLLRRGKPMLSQDVAFVAPCATLIGSVYVGANSSIFYKAILRADNCDHAQFFSQIDDKSFSEPLQLDVMWELEENRFDRGGNSNSTATGGGIFIGRDTNIQDGCIVDANRNHTKIGNGVTVGHLASIHSATIEDHCLIGMGSLLQSGVLVKTESFIAAGANLPENTVVESGELWVGNPARKLRNLTQLEREKLHYQAQEYVGVATNQRHVMQLGGNLPESLLKYLTMDHDDVGAEDNNDSSDKEKDVLANRKEVNAEEVKTRLVSATITTK